MESKKLIWIVEDDKDVRAIYEDILADRNVNITFFEKIVLFELALKNNVAKPDLLIADLNLPDGNFLDFICKDESAEKMEFPFIIVSSLDDLDTLKDSFEEGALDYLTKPFKKNELLVKIDRIFAANAKSASGFEYDPYTQSLSKNGEIMAHLSLKEMKLFSILEESMGKPIPREKLFGELWPDKPVVSKTLDVHIFNMRKKLRKAGLVIKAFKSPSSFALLQD